MTREGLGTSEREGKEGRVDMFLVMLEGTNTKKRLYYTGLIS